MSDQYLSEVGINPPIALPIGIGKRIASDHAAEPGVIQFRLQGTQAGFDVAEAFAVRAYPRTEQKLTLCVEEVDTDVLCSSHGGEHAMQLVRSVCADAGENVAAVGAAVAQVSA
jgi:hypothetical protein